MFVGTKNDGLWSELFVFQDFFWMFGQVKRCSIGLRARAGATKTHSSVVPLRFLKSLCITHKKQLVLDTNTYNILSVSINDVRS